MKSEGLVILKSELQKGMSLEKCRKCGCMKDLLNYSAVLKMKMNLI